MLSAAATTRLQLPERLLGVFKVLRSSLHISILLCSPKTAVSVGPQHAVVAALAPWLSPCWLPGQ